MRESRSKIIEIFKKFLEDNHAYNTYFQYSKNTEIVLAGDIDRFISSAFVWDSTKSFDFWSGLDTKWKYICETL